MLRLYLSKSRVQLFRGLHIIIPKGCFPPLHTVSTEAMAFALEKIGKIDGTVVEIGCGPGSLILFLARIRQTVYLVGTDVSLECVRAARLNAIRNKVYEKVDFLVCDSGSCIRKNSATLCITNPPFLTYEEKDVLDLSLAGGLNLENAMNMILDCYEVVSSKGVVVYTLSDLGTGRKLRAPGKLVVSKRGLGDTLHVFILTR